MVCEGIWYVKVCEGMWCEWRSFHCMYVVDKDKEVSKDGSKKLKLDSSVPE